MIAECGELHVETSLNDLREDLVKGEAQEGKELQLEKLSKSDPLVVSTSEVSGEHVFTECYELPVETWLKDLSEELVKVEAKDGKKLPKLQKS